MPRLHLLTVLLLVSSVFAGLQASINDRNYYADEIVITNHSLTFNSTGGNLSTRWGTDLGDNIKGIITEGMLDYAASGNLSARYNRSTDRSRLAYAITGDYQFQQINHTRNIWFSQAESLAYANDISLLMTYYFEGRPFVSASGNCIRINSPEVYLPVRNSIWLNHWKYPFIHITESENEWCFDSG